MATILARISLTVQDINGPKASTPVYLEITDTQTVAQVMTELTTYAGLVEALSDGKVVRQTITLSQLPAGQDGKPASSSFVSRVATFNFANTAHRKSGVVVPSFLQSKVTGGKIVLSDTDVAALTAHIEGSSAPLQYTDANGLSLSTFADAFLGSRKHRRAQHAESIEYED